MRKARSDRHLMIADKQAKRSNNKMLLLIGNSGTAQRVTGLSVAFDMLLSALKERRLKFILIDRSCIGVSERTGALSIGRAVNMAALLSRLYFNLLHASIVYMTIASSFFGFIRDALIIWPSRLLGRRIVMHLHGGGLADFYANSSKILKFFVRRTLAQADTIIILGELLRNQFDFLPGKAQKIRVVPNGLPDGLHRLATVPKSLPPLGERLYLLYLSNMIESKGYLDVLETCRILKYDVGLNICCDFCGSFASSITDETGLSAKEARDKFLSMIEHRELADVITYHGLVGGELKEKMLQRAHFFLLPTYYPWEGQPISIIEAIAFGTPVVTTCFRGIPEIILHEYNGFFVDSKAPDQIANSIRTIVGDPDRYRKMSENAIRHFELNFTRESHVQRLMEAIFSEAKVPLRGSS